MAHIHTLVLLHFLAMFNLVLAWPAILPHFRISSHPANGAVSASPRQDIRSKRLRSFPFQSGLWGKGGLLLACPRTQPSPVAGVLVLSLPPNPGFRSSVAATRPLLGRTLPLSAWVYEYTAPQAQGTLPPANPSEPLHCREYSDKAH